MGRCPFVGGSDGRFRVAGDLAGRARLEIALEPLRSGVQPSPTFTVAEVGVRAERRRRTAIPEVTAARGRRAVAADHLGTASGTDVCEVIRPARLIDRNPPTPSGAAAAWRASRSAARVVDAAPLCTALLPRRPQVTPNPSPMSLRPLRKTEA
jgi:hypothetical protein